MVVYCASLLLLVLGLLVAFIDAAKELSVTVYEGPKECDDADKVKKGDFLSMHYTGTIDESSETGESGLRFDSSRDRGETFDFTIGVGQVIKGWDDGLIGLCKGAKATLIIPPEMGYGTSGVDRVIPGGATLNFDVEVVDIGHITDEQGNVPNLFEILDKNGDGFLSKEEIESYFRDQGTSIPEGLMDTEDKDGNGFISWEEFSGPKGDTPPPPPYSTTDEL